MGKTIFKHSFVANKSFFLSPSGLSFDCVDLSIVENSNPISLIIFILAYVKHPILKLKVPSTFFFTLHEVSTVLSMPIHEFSLPWEKLILIKRTIILVLSDAQLLIFQILIIILITLKPC